MITLLIISIWKHITKSYHTTEEEKYLNDAVDISDLENRIQKLTYKSQQYF